MMNFCCFTPVKYAVPAISAYWKCMNGEAYILHYDRDGLGGYIKRGLSREYIELIGRNPYHELSDRLLYNRVLVEGDIQEDMGAFYNKKVLRVTDWEIIFPVTREYSLSDYEKSRWMGPLFFIDEFDVETGNMRERKNAEYTISDMEARFLTHKYDTEYVIVTAEVMEDEVVWHEVRYQLNEDASISEEAICLTGENLPEDCLSRDVIFNGDIQKYINRFLIHGTREDNTIAVESWKILTPFENQAVGAGRYFLEDKDFVEKQEGKPIWREID